MEKRWGVYARYRDKILCERPLPPSLPPSLLACIYSEKENGNPNFVISPLRPKGAAFLAMSLTRDETPARNVTSLHSLPNEFDRVIYFLT